MRLHHFLENPKVCLKAKGVDAETLEFFTALKDDYVQFDFGDITPIPTKEWVDLQEFALDLMGVDAFALPFPSVAFSYRADGRHHLTLATEYPPNLGVMFLSPVWQSGDFLNAYVGQIDLKRSGEVHKFAVQRPLTMTPNESQSCIVTAYALSALCALLRAKGVEERVSPAPERLNKKRVRLGKPAIGETREIFIRHEGARYTAGGESVNDRTSPRCHWRRGHVRRLPSGDFTQVRPCLVSATSGGSPAPKTT